MDIPVSKDILGRAAQAILCWTDRDLISLCRLLTKIDTLDEARDIIVAMAMLANMDAGEVQDILLNTTLG